MAILSDFDGGRSLHDTQHFHLGQEVYDSQGNRWGYVQINEASGGAHRLLRSTKHSDIMSAGNGIVNEAIAVGSDRLKVAGTTNRDFTASGTGPIVGGLGVITAGGGRGQRFWIKRVVDDDEVVVEVLDNDTGKWTTALTTASRFYLWFPGMALQGDGLDDFVEGVLHVEAEDGDKGKFAYVQRSGLGLVTLDNTDNGNVVGQGQSDYSDWQRVGRGIVRGFRCVRGGRDSTNGTGSSSCCGHCAVRHLRSQYRHYCAGACTVWIFQRRVFRLRVHGLRIRIIVLVWGRIRIGSF